MEIRYVMKTVPIQDFGRLSHLATDNKVMEIMERQISQLPPPPEGCYYTINNPKFSFNYNERAYEVSFDVVLKKAQEGTAMIDYKQKYNEALEDMRVIYPNLKGDAKLAVEHAFPELAESEDERIRKELIELVRETVNEPNRGGITVNKEEKYIAWLEKQKINTEGDFGRGYDCGYQAGYSVAMNEMKPKVATATLDSEKQKEQKPASWSEEDDLMMKAVIGILGEKDHPRLCAWVKALKEAKEK